MCEVSYKTYNGENKDVFLQEGDKIAVISPSALPSREQTDAVLAGIVFGEWTDLSPDLDDYSGVNRGGAYTSVADMISRQFLPDISCPRGIRISCRTW